MLKLMDAISVMDIMKGQKIGLKIGEVEDAGETGESGETEATNFEADELTEKSRSTRVFA